MKKYFLQLSLITVLVVGFSCKSKKQEAPATPTTIDTIAKTPTAPVTINPDDALTSGVKDATKDFPDVNATVSGGVITLTGTIEKSRYITLKQSLDALHPKQVVNNLKYK